MKYILTLILLYSALFADLSTLNSFRADFTQTITDDKGKTLSYKGSIKAKKPQYATWNYTSPVEKNVFINADKIVMVEPELEQVVIKHIENKFDFFNMIKYAKQIDENLYIAHYKDTKFQIKIVNSIVSSIMYEDEFGNQIDISFKNQLQNTPIDSKEFTPVYPLNYDIIRG